MKPVAPAGSVPRTACGNPHLAGLACDALARHGCRPAMPAAARERLGLALEEAA